MKKKRVLLPVFAALSFMLLNSVPVAATTTVTQSEYREAFAQWSDGTFVLVGAGNTEIQSSYPPYSLGKIFIIASGDTIGITLKQLAPDGIIMKALAPAEFKWSLISCRVSTEIDGHTLVVEWKTVPPTTVYHGHMYMDSMHLKGNGVMRWASATLMWDGQTLLENAIYAVVSRGIGLNITKTQ